MTDRFAEVVAGPEDGLALDEAALLIAAHGQPGLDVGAELARLDGVAGACPAPTLDALCWTLFSQLGLRGNVADYQNPKNSYLNAVLDTGLGIPISLAVITMEVGRRLGVHLDGIGMPGHFLVGDAADVETRYLDPFAGGSRLDEAGVAELFRRVAGGRPFDPSYLAPVGPRAIVLRMLANLQQIFLPRDLSSAAWVLRLRLLVPGLTPPERAAAARGLGSLGQFQPAAAALDALAGEVTGPEADALRAEANRLRSRNN